MHSLIIIRNCEFVSNIFTY